MSLVALVLSITGFAGTQYAVGVQYVDPTNSIYDQERLLFADTTAISFPQLIADTQTAVLSYAAGAGYTLTASQIVWGSLNSTNRTFNFGVTHSFVTGTGANGFQVSATQDSTVNYNVTVVTTSTIASGQLGTVVLEVAPTNSAISSDWKEVARCTNGQVYSLALALQGIATAGCALPTEIPAGYYAKLRTISTTGAPTFTYNSGMETLQ